jgi:hypothetical protein
VVQDDQDIPIRLCVGLVAGIRPQRETRPSTVDHRGIQGRPSMLSVFVECSPSWIALRVWDDCREGRFSTLIR